VTIYADELERRIKSGEPIELTRRWYMTAFLSLPTFPFDDLDPVETQFLVDTLNALWGWVRQQPGFSLEAFDEEMVKTQVEDTEKEGIFSIRLINRWLSWPGTVQ
jgi:hypothetical protein